MALSSLRPLRSRNFALVWSAALVSNIGSWVQTVALGVVIFARTHNPLWVGAIAAAAFIPMGLLSPVGGALADRFDRRRWLILTTCAEALAAAMLAVLFATGHANAPAMVLLAFLGGVATAIGFPTYQAMLPDLVPADDLLAAVSLSSAQFNLGRVVGPALAGVVLVAWSATGAFALNAASFGAVIVALLFVRLPPRPTAATGESIVERIRDGVRIVAGEPGCRNAILLIGFVALTGSPFIALVPAVACEHVRCTAEQIHRGAAGTSLLVTAQGIGAVTGALVLAPLAAALGRRRLLVRALITFPVVLIAYGAAPSLLAAAVAIVFVGGCYIGVLAGLNTVVQVRAPAEARGRILGLYMMALGTIYPIGALLQGAVARLVGVGTTTVAAAVVLLGAMVGLAIWRPQVFEALDDPEPVPSEPPPAAPPIAGSAVAPPAGATIA